MHQHSRSVYASKKVTIDLNRDMGSPNKRVETTVEETPFEKKKERVNISSAQRARKRETSEEVKVREEVRKVDGNIVKTIITKKILLDVEAIVEPPKQNVALYKGLRKTRSDRKGKLTGCSEASKSPRGSPHDLPLQVDVFSPKAKFAHLDKYRSVPASPVYKTPEAMKYQPNIDTEAKQNVVLNNSPDTQEETPSDQHRHESKHNFSPRKEGSSGKKRRSPASRKKDSGKKQTEAEKKSRNALSPGRDSLARSQYIQPNIGDDDTDPALKQLVDDIFDKYDVDLDGVIKWPKGIDEVLRWADEDLGC